PNFPSLNLAAAAMVLLYELRVAFARDDDGDGVAADDEPRASGEEMRNFYRHLQRLLNALSFGETRSADKLQRKLTRLFNRTHPYAQEVRMLRGIFAAVEARLNDDARANDRSSPRD
ncbi:MAG: hypothetical protein ACR2P7_02465, partial [bacterium]